MTRMLLISVSLVIAVVTFIGSARVSAEANPDLFKSVVARIEVQKPAGWHFMDIESVAKHRATAKLKDEEMQKAIQEMASAPLVVATMHPEPYESLNPSFQVLVRPLGGLKGSSGADILGLILPALEKSFEDFQLIEPITVVEVDGLDGAALMASYTVVNQSEEVFPTLAFMMVVPRESYMYQFSLSAPPEGDDAIGDEELFAVIESIRFLE